MAILLVFKVRAEIVFENVEFSGTFSVESSPIIPAPENVAENVKLEFSGTYSVESSPIIPAPSSPPSLDPSLPIRPVTSFTACGSQDSIITRYSKTSLCIEFVNPRTFSSGSTSQLSRALFDPIADTLSSITVQGSYALNNKSLESTLLVVSSNAA